MYIELEGFKDLEYVKLCAIDYFKGVGPFGSPFIFLSYGITYPRMVYFAKFSVGFMNFIFHYVATEEKQSNVDRAVDFLHDSCLLDDEIEDKLTVTITEVNK
jgi:hypothetical protein